MVGTAAMMVVVSLPLYRRSGYRRPAGQGRGASGRAAQDTWFTADVLEGFPVEAVRALLLRLGAPSLSRLYGMAAGYRGP